jgi:hypothetical protein
MARSTASRKIFALVATLAGVVLLAFEVRTLLRDSGDASWFWLAVALLLTALGVTDLVASARGSGDLR